MKNKLIFGLIFLLIILFITFAIFNGGNEEPFVEDFDSTHDSPLNATYIIDETSYTLENGKIEMEAYPGSSEKIITEIFGQPVPGDLNNDHRVDYSMFLVQRTGGTGSFYFVVSAISLNDGKLLGTNAVYLGDRIAPQNIQVENGIVIANYADRKSGEAMTVKPSMGISKYIKLTDLFLKEVEYLKIKEEQCINRKGVWYKEEKSCEINQLSKSECESQNGEFNECASACRHDKEAKVCTLQCVLTCTFR